MRYSFRLGLEVLSSRLGKNSVYAKKRPKYSEWHRGQNNHRMLKKAVQQGRSQQLHFEL
jgi:hypothetical protein